MDVNPRVWTWHSIGARAGVDFPYLAWRSMHGDHPRGVRGRPGVRWVRPATDLFAARAAIRAGELGWSTYLRQMAPPAALAPWAFSDPSPAVADLPLLAARTARRWAAHRREARTGRAPATASGPAAFRPTSATVLREGTSVPDIPSVPDRGRFVTTYAALIVGVALVAVLAALDVHSRPTEYTSEVSVLVGSQVFANGVAEPPDMGTEKAVSSSGTVLSAAAERLGVPVDVLDDGASAGVPVDTHVLVLSQSASTAAAARRHTAARAAAYVEYRDQPQVPKLGATGEAARPSQTLRVITAPSSPTAPDEPNLVLVLTVALVLGGGLGLAAAVALDSGSDRIRGPGDLGRVSGLPVLAEVPGTLHPARGIPVLDQQPSGESDAYYRVTAATLTAASRRGTRVVLVTSGARYDGVTTSAANIAVAMAESATKTLLVLADPLGPTLRQLMGTVIPPGPGPSPVGSEDASFGVLPGLRVADLTGGDRVPLRRGGDIAKAVAAVLGRQSW